MDYQKRSFTLPSNTTIFLRKAIVDARILGDTMAYSAFGEGDTTCIGHAGGYASKNKRLAYGSRYEFLSYSIYTGLSLLSFIGPIAPTMRDTSLSK